MNNFPQIITKVLANTYSCFAGLLDGVDAQDVDAIPRNNTLTQKPVEVVILLNEG